MEYNTKEFDIYADDIISCTYGQSFDEMTEKLEIDISKICEWF